MKSWLKRRTPQCLMAALAALTILAAGCSSRTLAATKSPNPMSTQATPPGAHSSSGAAELASRGGTDAQSPYGQATSIGQYSDPSKPLTPQQLTYSPDPTIPIDAVVTPACVPPGGVATLHVKTEKKAIVAYQAIYSDGHAGTPRPYGAGYGGNAGGKVDATGGYTSSWTLSANAPLGKGRVDVIVGLPGGRRGYKPVSWVVAGTPC